MAKGGMRRNSPYSQALTRMRKAKRAKIAPAEALALRRDAMEKSAKEQGWRPSELAMALADDLMAARAVWNDPKIDWPPRTQPRPQLDAPIPPTAH